MLDVMKQPLKIGMCTIPNRFVVTAMVTSMCTPEGYATDQFVKYHEAKAKGGWGLIITEDYGINRNAAGYARVAGLYKEDQIEGHRKLVDAVHKYGTKIFCQIYHAGRQSSAQVNGGAQVVACSPSECPWNRDMARELTIDEIHELVRQFGVAAGNAKKAGFDGIEIHAGNGYLIAGFMSYYQNKRVDEYGGCFDNRMRFLHEVVDSCRAAVGADFPIMVRFSADEHVLSGRTLAESRMVAKKLEEWRVDAINCSNGVYGTYNPGQVSPSYAGHAWTIQNAKELKSLVSIPVLGCNSVDDPLMAASYVEEGVCDMVGMARCSLADPELPKKAFEGRFDEIRPCVRCMEGCVTSTYMQIPLRCMMNPMLGHEFEYTFEDEVPSRKVLIVGGGPAGAWAAIAARRRGHDVTIWEKEDRLGGQFTSAAYPPGKGDYIALCSFFQAEVAKLGIKVEYGKRACANDVLAFNADKVIIATGALPKMPPIAGVGSSSIVRWPEDILLGREQVEGRIFIVGSGESGVETAMYLADGERGAITVVARGDALCRKADGTRVVAMKRFLNEREVDVWYHSQTKEVTDDGIVIERDGEDRFYPADAVIVALGYKPENALAEELSDLGDKLVVIGDAKECSNALEAGVQGFAAGYNA